MNIESIRELHNAAMVHVERSIVLKFADDAVKTMLRDEDSKIESADAELRKAIQLEVKAAQFASEIDDRETQALLTKSAAAIAFQLGEYHRAIDLAKSLLPYAPTSIVVETERMIETIKQAMDENFISVSEPKPTPLLKNPIKWNSQLPILIGAAVCAVIALSVLSSGGASIEWIYLVVVAVAVLIFLNIVR